MHYFSYYLISIPPPRCCKALSSPGILLREQSLTFMYQKLPGH